MTTTSPTSPGREYWLIWSTPNSGVAAEEFDAVLDEHLAWTRRLEEEGAVLCSGPLLSGPGTRPGAGMTVLRAANEQAASDSPPRTRSSGTDSAGSPSTGGSSRRARSMCAST